MDRTKIDIKTEYNTNYHPVFDDFKINPVKYRDYCSDEKLLDY